MRKTKPKNPNVTTEPSKLPPQSEADGGFARHTQRMRDMTKDLDALADRTFSEPYPDSDGNGTLTNAERGTAGPGTWASPGFTALDLPILTNRETNLLNGIADAEIGETDMGAVQHMHEMMADFGVKVTDDIPVQHLEGGDAVRHITPGNGGTIQGRVIWTRKNNHGKPEALIEWPPPIGRKLLVGDMLNLVEVVPASENPFKFIGSDDRPLGDYQDGEVDEEVAYQFEFPPPRPPEERVLTLRRDVLMEAIKTTEPDGPRADSYGSAQEGFGKVAAIWSAILGFQVEAWQVGAMMAGLKLARVASDPLHRDSWVDIAGYAALGAEVAGVDGRDL